MSELNQSGSGAVALLKRRRVQAVLAVTVAFFLIGACGGDPDTEEATDPATTSEPSPAEEPAEEKPERSKDCKPIAKDFARAIVVDGVEPGVGSVKVAGKAWAVRSEDFSKVYFIAVPFTVPGVNETQTGVWASNSTERGGGVIMAVDGFAKEFTVWPDADKTDAQATIANDGADEAVECVTAP